MKNIRIVYMGTPELSAYILEGLIKEGLNIVGLVAQQDKPVGRKNIIQPVPTKIIAEKYNIPVFQPNKIRNDFDFIKNLHPDLIITCAYGQIVPTELLKIPTIACINVHGSLLPKYRGASPIQSALINNEKVTGVTIMEMIDKMDAGRMIYQKSFNIDDEDNYSTLCNKIAKCGLSALIESIPGIIDKTLPWIEQKEDEVSYCSKITKEDEHLNLNDNAINIINKIRGLADNPGSFVYLDNQIFKIYKAKYYSNQLGIIGTIVQADKNGLILQVKDGQIALLEVQKQGKKRMDYKSFLNGEKNLFNKIVS